jgi:hypothetical protein
MGFETYVRVLQHWYQNGEVGRTTYPRLPPMWKDRERATRVALSGPGSLLCLGTPYVFSFWMESVHTATEITF